MKKFLFVCLLCLGGLLNVWAQNADVMHLHNGEELNVNVKQITENAITYSYPGESMTQDISKNLVEKIVFGSGRVQEISEKIIINDEDDWKKVIITSLESDIKGLVRKGEVKGSKTGSALSNTAKIQAKAEQEMKEEAAKLGAHVIFIKDYNVQHGGGMNAATGFGRNAKAALSGIAYGYE